MLVVQTSGQLGFPKSNGEEVIIGILVTVVIVANVAATVVIWNWNRAVACRYFCELGLRIVVHHVCVDGCRIRIFTPRATR